MHFIIFKAFNGLLSGSVAIGNDNKAILRNVPANEPVTLIAFTKNNGQLYHCKEEFASQKNRSLSLDFKNISAEEMTKLFGKNVRI